MAGLMSKRQQARNEKQLQELIKTVPGNDRCADCGTKNPGWASWSLGIFLCMSCAALHRKMGTHISKVKSLSMDSWSNDQVDNMKKTGNATSNKKYNPGNARPDIPIDSDEVGGVMERFIRRKYELREFSGGSGSGGGGGGGSGRQATINNTGNASMSSTDDQPPPLPPKPGKKFGFALRSASATFSRPRMDKYTPPMSPDFGDDDGRNSPPMNKASRVFGSAVGNARDDAFKSKMASLREMGFTDARRNSFVLKEMNGSLSGTIEALVRLGEGPNSRNMTPVSGASGTGLTVEKRRAQDIPPQAPPKDTKDKVDPFAALDYESQPQPPQRSVTQPLPQTSQAQPQSQASYNPFFSMASQNQAPPNQAPQALSDSFAGMQLSQQNPYSNGQAQQMQPPQPQQNNQYNPFMNTNQQSQMQYPAQQQPQAQAAPQQQSQNPYAQPIQPQHTSNPYAQPILPQHTSNPFLRATKSQTFPQPQSNPFMQQSAPQNPWLVSQAASQSSQPQQPMYQTQGQPDYLASQQVQQQQQQQQQQPQYQQQNGHDPAQSNYVLANGNNPFYAQNNVQQQQQQQQQPPSQSFNPYQSFQSQPAPQQQQPLQNRHDKASILQLYNYPQMAPSRPLQSLQEEPAMQQPTAQPTHMTSPGRSVTMPIMGTMNPFMSSASGQAAPPTAPYHTSRDSVMFVGLGNGRQSPDAFAGLSAQYGR